MERDLEQMGRENGWPCVVSSIWQEPGFCPYYGDAGCPYTHREDKPCKLEDDVFVGDLVPFLFFD